MNETIDKEMLVYEAELQSIVRENKAASNAVSVDKFELDMSKKIYRRLAKKLHPDVNKMTEKDERLQDLWEKIRIAYKNSDVDRLEELEVLVNAVFKELGEEAIEMDLSNLEEKISNLEDRIAQILTEKPYIYGKLLDDEDKVSAKKEEMEKELKEYKDYAAELEEILADLMMKGGASITWTSK